MMEWIRTHLNESFAILAGLVILTGALFNQGWWGDRSLGVLIGGAGIVLIMWISVVTLERIAPASVDKSMPWIMVAAPTAIALILRTPGDYRLAWPIQVQVPYTPQPQSLLLILIAVFLLILLIGFFRALGRGEGVAVESHWGGLGGGISGFQVSMPLIYLLGIIFLLAVSSAVAWRIYTPVGEQVPQQQAQRQQATPAQTGSEATTTAASPSPPPPSPSASPQR